MRRIFILQTFFLIASHLYASENSLELYRAEAEILKASLEEEQNHLDELREPLKKLEKLQTSLKEHQADLIAYKHNLKMLNQTLQDAAPENEEELRYCQETKQECVHLRKNVRFLTKKIFRLTRKMKPLALNAPWSDILFLEKHINGIQAILDLSKVQTINEHALGQSLASNQPPYQIASLSSRQRRRYDPDNVDDANENEHERTLRLNSVVYLERDSNGRMTRRIRRNIRMEDA